MGMIQHLSDEILYLLEKMDLCSQTMEDILQEENKAVHSFDGELLETLAEQRLCCQHQWVALEEQWQAILERYQLSKDMTLEVFIDTKLGALHTDAQALQHMRQRVLQRMEWIQQANEEQRIRLHAAWSVTTHVLQEIGMLPVQESYGRGATL